MSDEALRDRIRFRIGEYRDLDSKLAGELRKYITKDSVFRIYKGSKKGCDVTVVEAFISVSSGDQSRIRVRNAAGREYMVNSHWLVYGEKTGRAGK